MIINLVRSPARSIAHRVDAEPALSSRRIGSRVAQRNQAEKASRTQALYEKRVGGWLSWSQAQEARWAYPPRAAYPCRFA